MRKWLPYRTVRYDWEENPGTRYWHKGWLWDVHGEERKMYIISDMRMKLRRVWFYANAKPISDRWSGHFAKWRSNA